MKTKPKDTKVEIPEPTLKDVINMILVFRKEANIFRKEVNQNHYALSSHVGTLMEHSMRKAGAEMFGKRYVDFFLV
jgi:hypothetical protein